MRLIVCISVWKLADIYEVPLMDRDGPKTLGKNWRALSVYMALHRIVYADCVAKLVHEFI